MSGCYLTRMARSDLRQLAAEIGVRDRGNIGCASFWLATNYRIKNLAGPQGVYGATASRRSTLAFPN